MGCFRIANVPGARSKSDGAARRRHRVADLIRQLEQLRDELIRNYRQSPQE
jgi:hypothetical protein